MGESKEPPAPEEAPFDEERYRRSDIARMTQETLMRMVASRPGQITAAMIESNADLTFEACTAIHDACARFCLSQEERNELQKLAEAKAKKAAEKEAKEAAKVLENAKQQEKKDAEAKRALAELEARKGGGTQ